MSTCWRHSFSVVDPPLRNWWTVHFTKQVFLKRSWRSQIQRNKSENLTQLCKAFKLKWSKYISVRWFKNDFWKVWEIIEFFFNLLCGNFTCWIQWCNCLWTTIWRTSGLLTIIPGISIYTMFCCHSNRCSSSQRLFMSRCLLGVIWRAKRLWLLVLGRFYL